ncbi:MAG: hypothetical protein OXF23_03800 [Candidatus Dadabacteria bacterium]|nr:hypothetical protein [Candidatus Dadabacteria bacterium]
MGIKYSSPEVNRQITKQLINDYGAIVSTLVKAFGYESLEHVQRVCANSFEKMRTRWGKEGIPEDPQGAVWKNITENSNKLFCRKINYLARATSEEGAIDVSDFQLPFPEKEEMAKNQVEMLFALCSLQIENSLRKQLILNILCGFSTSSLARILEKNEKTLEDLLASEKKNITETSVKLTREDKEQKLSRATSSIYEIFSLGQSGLRKGAAPIAPLCFAAIRLGEMLLDFPSTQKPHVHALVSFMLLNASRLRTMNDGAGRPLGIKEQNRELWDRNMIRKGFDHLALSAREGEEVTEIHLKAAVDAVHSLAEKYGDTNWDHIISLYDKYLACNYCPLVALQKAIAISKTRGPQEALQAISGIREVEKLGSHDLFYSTLGNLHFQLHRYEDAILNFNRAIGLSDTSFEKTFYSKKIKICEDRMNMSKLYRHEVSF